jgi:trk system potassium uptake protein TrkH
MNIKSVINVISSIIVVVGLIILTAVPVSYLMHDDTKTIFALLISALIPIFAGVLGFLFSKTDSYKLGRREGFGIVTFGWIAAAAFGAIPFIIVSDLTWYDAFFETMSGFTTTGASILDNTLILNSGKTLKYGIKDLPYGLLYWRSMTHWLGGMGIIVLSLAIIPFLGIGGQQLYNAEVPGPTSDQLTPRIANSAKILWVVYILLSIIETLLLLPAMPFFDAWCHTCGTMATGGFSTLQSSVGGFNSAYIDWILTLFMFLAGGNFVLHYRALKGKPLFHFQDEEFKWYLGITLLSTICITVGLMITNSSIITTAGLQVPVTFINSLRYSAFQVVSIMTTTGFCTANFDLWPVYTVILLLLLMFIGGCGGSTGGGMKVSRFILLLKYSGLQLQRCLFPHLISNIRLNKSRVNTETLHKVLSFFFLFIFLYIMFSLVLSIFPSIDFKTAISASIASLGNIGPGISKVGATCTYAWMHPAAKIILTIAMLIGRLEIYTVLVIILPTFWKK